MIIKKIRAGTSEEAKKIIDEELGPKAIILTTRVVKERGIKALFSTEKIEVTAAINEEEMAEHEKKKKNATRRVEKEKKPTSSSMENLGDNLADLKKVLGGVTEEEEEEKASPVISKPNIATSAPSLAGTYGDPRLAKKTPRMVTEQLLPAGTGDQLTLSSRAQEQRELPTKTVKSSPNSSSINSEEVAEFSKRLVSKFKGSITKEEEEITEKENQPKKVELLEKKNKRAEVKKEEDDAVDMKAMRRMIREEFLRAQKSVGVGELENNSEDVVGSVRFLISKGISRSIALDIEGRLDKKMGKVDLTIPGNQRNQRINAMKRELTSLIKTAGPLFLKEKEPTIVALVGPTGVGKTTTLVKIASQYSSTLNRKVGVISLDLEKVGAQEQLQGLTAPLGIPSMAVGNQQQLLAAIQKFQDRDLILIDTAGRSAFDWKEVDDLSEILDGVENLQVLLTLSITTKEVDIYGIVQQFKPLNVESLIFTKLDETTDYGVLVNICEKSKLPLRYLSTGRKVPNDLRIAESSDIARKILVKHNSQELQKLRKLAHA